MKDMNIPHLQTNIPLSGYTTYGVGGPAKFFLIASNKNELLHALQEAHREAVPTFVFGGGSDILVADQGFPGLVIKMELREMNFSGTTVRAEAGVKLSYLITECLRHELSGLEYAIGVPATVGGGVWANLGARGSEIKDVLTQVHAIDPTQAMKELFLTNQECQFAYRESIFKHKPYIILDATFNLKLIDKTVLQARLKELAKLRTTEQDLGSKTAGCAFRNPSADKPAGKLIELAGLKGFSLGGAKVSEKHANFIVNTGKASADEIAQLISYIKQQVRDQFGVQLQEEVKYVGFQFPQV